MEMNKNNNSNTVSAGMKNFAVRPKSLTPSVLGVANSHGVKLSLNMTSEDKKELMSKLEEWRQARKEKLAARILGKQKQFEKLNLSISVPAAKLKRPSVLNDGAPKIQERQSVFDRLYNTGKIKRSDVSNTSNKPTMIPKANFRKSNFLRSEKPNKSVQPPSTGADETNPIPAVKECEPSSDEPLTESSAHDFDSPSANENEEPEMTTYAHESITASDEDSAKTQEEAATVSLEKSRQREALGSFVSSIPLKLVGAEKAKNPLRRSISMMFRQKCRKEYSVRKSFSAKNLSELPSSARQKLNDAAPNAVPRFPGGCEAEDKAGPPQKSVSFLTPGREKAVGEGNLRIKLENWLKKNGHTLEGYRHLRCFGVEKSSAALPSDGFPGGRETLPREWTASCTPSSSADADEDKENVTPPTVPRRADAEEAEKWLRELHRLMVELKYPSERCEEWLAAIRKRCGECAQLPIYWECLAALHESKGDLKSAIEDYEKVIIKGGEVDAVGDSLAQLFEKMVIEQGRRSKPKLEKGLDPKNIFKSTIIKFALQQRALKSLDSSIDPEVRQQLYVATPVRRSTRIQTPYKSKEEVASLQTLTPELRKNVIFKPNDSLLFEN